MTISTWAAMLIALAGGVGAATPAPVGQFADHRDIGGPAHPGSATYDAATGTYRLVGGGGNMWADHDAFQFAWKPMSGDVAMTADLDFVSPKPAPTAGGFLHRKGGLVLRQDLDPDSAYVDAVRMSNEQLSLQYREVKGGPTRLIWINTGRQQAIGLRKIGDYAYLLVPGPDGTLRPAGGSFRLKITGTYYIGLGVCAHDDTTSETMAFRNVAIAPLPAGSARPQGMTLETIQIANPLEQTALHHAPGPIAVAGWSPDGTAVTFRADGALRRAVAWDSDRVEPATGAGGSPAGPAPGAGWVYSSAPAGRGLALWRARADGSERTRIATGDASAFAPRLSPDGKWLAWLASDTPGTAIAPRSDLALRLMPVADGLPQPDKAITLSEFVGGADSLGPAAWSPDTRLVAFVAHD